MTLEKIILLAVVLILFIIFVILFIKFDWFKKIVYKMILAAESAIKESGQGEKKKELVVTWVYERIPPFLKWLISKAYLSDLIDKIILEINKQIKK